MITPAPRIIVISLPWEVDESALRDHIAEFAVDHGLEMKAAGPSADSYFLSFQKPAMVLPFEGILRRIQRAIERNRASRGATP